METRELTYRLKELMTKGGADMVGIAPVRRWEHAPLQVSPQGIWPSSRSVISMGVRFPHSVMELGRQDSPQRSGKRSKDCISLAHTRANTNLQRLSWQAARFLRRHGFDALPIASTCIWRYRPYKDVDDIMVPDISHIHAAACAGLGEIGWNNLLLTPRFGSWQRLITIITDANLEADPLYYGQPLCDRCMECVRGCKRCAHGLIKEVRGKKRVQIEDKTFEYADINFWRCGWGENFQLPLADMPAGKIDEECIVEACAHLGNEGWTNGPCMKDCRPPHLRGNAPAALRKTTAADLTAEAMDKEADFLAVLSRSTVMASGYDIASYLPEGASLIIFGMSGLTVSTRVAIPHTNDGYCFSTGEANNRLMPLAVRIAGLLEDGGGAVLFDGELQEKMRELSPLLSGTAAADTAAKEMSDGKMVINAMVTTLPLTEIVWQRQPAIALSGLEAKIAGLAESSDLDMVGISGIRRLEDMGRQLQEALSSDLDTYFIAEDKGRHPNGPCIPMTRMHPLRVMLPKDHLADARSVIVLGLHFGDAPVETGGRHAAEVIGPYAIAQRLALTSLGEAAHRVARFLEENGHSAIVSYDLTGLASWVRGGLSTGTYYNDTWSNAPAAVCAGLGEFAENGQVITPAFGLRQRFIAILTDAVLQESPLYSGPSLCRRCGNCVSACSTGALQPEERISLKVEDRKFEFARLNRLRCDWAKRYTLTGDEGPRWLGSQTDILPPEGEITPQVLEEAMCRLDPLQKNYMCIMEPCLAACPVTGNARSRQAAREGDKPVING